jgi:hypothetical protein
MTASPSIAKLENLIEYKYQNVGDQLLLPNK